MPAKIKAKKTKTSAATRAPWLRLPERPDTTESQSVRMYMDGQVVDMTRRVREMPRVMDLDEAAGITLHINDPAGDLADLELLDADEDQLLDGIRIRWGSCWWQIARLERDGEGWRIEAEDIRASDCRARRRPMKASRKKMTRARFAYQLFRAASPSAPVYIPELNDRQKIQRAEQPKTKGWDAERAAKASGGATQGWGSAAGKVTIKGSKANSRQLAVLNDGWVEAARLGCSPRVMMAVAMAMTQESNMGELRESVTGQHWGPLHQSAAWGGSVNRGTASAVRAFLTLDKGPGVQGWRAKHGSLHSSAGNLGQMIDAVQIAGTPSAFGQWEKEARANLDLWLGRNKGATSRSAEKPEYYTAQYSFTTASGEEAVNWWDATGQLAEDVRWHRWAAGNTLGFASDDELIRGTPVMYLSREDPAVLDMPYTWDVRREAAEITVTLILRDEWQLLPGMVVMVNDEKPIDGRWIAKRIEDVPIGEDRTTQVTLRRRNAKSLEPASQIVQRQAKEKADKKIGGKDSYGPTREETRGGEPNSHNLVYPAAKHGTNGGGPAAHGARAWGNWQSDNAVDINLPRGTHIFAVADGVVTKLGGRWNGGSGNPDGWNVTLKTADNQWFYTHLMARSSAIKVGTRVKAGQYLGQSGAANGVNHLHIGCERGDPVKLLGV